MAHVASLGINPQSIAFGTRGQTIRMVRGDYWDFDIELGDITGWTKVSFTIKGAEDDPDVDTDDDALLKIETGENGLKRVNQAAPDSPANGILTVLDSKSGRCRVQVENVETTKLGLSECFFWDGQWQDDSVPKKRSRTPKSGTFVVARDATRTTT